MSVETPKAPPLPEEMDKQLRTLRLPHIRREAAEVLATAASQRWEPLEALRVLLETETKGRAEAAIRTRRKRSGLPAGKTFDAWEEEATSIPAATQQALRTLEWVDRGEDLCFCGPARWPRRSASRLSSVCQATVLPLSIARCPSASTKWLLPVPRRLGRQGDRQADQGRFGHRRRRRHGPGHRRGRRGALPPRRRRL